MTGVFLLGLLTAAVPPAVHAQTPGPVSRFISPLDYPVAARPNEGKVDLTLGIDEKGRVASCTVQKSSGSAILDRTTCVLLTRRLKARPAVTADGKPTSDIIQTSIDWHMPPPDMMNRLMGRGG